MSREIHVLYATGANDKTVMGRIAMSDVAFCGLESPKIWTSSVDDLETINNDPLDRFICPRCNLLATAALANGAKVDGQSIINKTWRVIVNPIELLRTLGFEL